MRIFLDANILFSASLPQSRMRKFLGIIFAHGTCLTNLYAVEEAYRNLNVKSPKSLSSLKILVKECELVSSIATDVPVKLPSKDIPILCGAIAGGATHLLTGDEKDFGALWNKTIRGVKIVSPKLLAQELRKKKLL